MATKRPPKLDRVAQAVADQDFGERTAARGRQLKAQAKAMPPVSELVKQAKPRPKG